MSIITSAKIVLITGANQGIGFEIAKALSSKRDYHVLLGSRNAKRGVDAAVQLQQQGLSVEAITIDVTSDDSLATAVKEITSKFGRLDILINNAGIALKEEGGDKPISSSALRNLYQEMFAVNTFGAALTTEAFISLLSASLHPRIVFMSSDLASLTNRPKSPVVLPIYRSSKAALNMLMLHYACKYKDSGWKVNSCCPGYCATNLNDFAGYNTAESGAVNAVRLATLGDDGESGTYSNTEGVIDW